ncbi:MAG: uroporphyrinogen decarboxylase family protein [Verrucomicrobia bacterium]|nr:uroporphyrinogen decarboxylase family protein [Verrucomicrobiota bacterium]
MPNRFVSLVLNSPRRLAMPIAVYPGATLIGARVQDIVTNARTQFEASAALHHRFHTPFALSAMDLSVEAEAFGAQLVMSANEIPTVVGRWVTSLSQAQALAVPKPGDKRTRVYLEAVSLLKQLPNKPMVLAGCIGPFSLAGRLAGVSEALELTLSEPDLMHTLLAKCAQFLTSYVQAFKAAGADGVIMAEPGAGLLSPRGMSQFSSAYIRSIVTAVSGDGFSFILHNCAAKVLHLPALLETGSQVYHFGAPMDLVAALGKVSSETVLCGNLDPSAVFVQSTPVEVAQRTRNLLEATKDHRNYVISSGCDVPPPSSMANLDVFFKTVNG